MIPADARILEAKDLFISQASLTGESEPVEKFAKTYQEKIFLLLIIIIFYSWEVM